MSQIGLISPERVSGLTSQKLCIVGGRTLVQILWSQSPHLEQLHHNFQKADSVTRGLTCVRVSLWEQICPWKAHSSGVWMCDGSVVFTFFLSNTVFHHDYKVLSWFVHWVCCGLNNQGARSDKEYGLHLYLYGSPCIWWCLGRRGDSISGWRDILGVPRMGR